MRTTIDNAGRVVVPKPLRDALGLGPGSTLEITLYGNGLQLTPGSRTAHLVKVDGRLVADSTTTITDDDVFLLLDTDRR